MTFYRYLLGLCLLLTTGQIFSQGSTLRLGNEAYHLVDRLSIKTGLQAPFFNSLRPFRRGDLATYAIHLDTTANGLSEKDRRDLNYIFLDNNEWLEAPELPTTLTGPREPVYKKVYVDSSKTFYTIESYQPEASFQDLRYIEREKPLLRYFYKTPANLFQIDKPFFQLRVNPILDISYGRDQKNSSAIFYNRRGVEIRGGIDDRIYFYSSILETQARFQDYVNDRIDRDKAVPGAGLFKRYSSDVFNIENGYDFLLSQGYVGFNVTKHVGVQFGHGRNFIGNGYRSLILSDYAPNYLYLKLNTRVWKLHYQNIFTELAAEGPLDNQTGTALTRKYMAAHYLSYRPNKNLRIGLVEMVIFNRDKATQNKFDLQYLNPIIFYRTVEHGLDSPDNILIGLDGSWNFLRCFQLYGQVVFDEFKFDELFLIREGWWANKYGIQVGLKYINMFGIDHLDGQVEINTVRPYAYTHRDSLANFTHLNQSLAHPVGANFKEYLAKLRYTIGSKWVLNSRLLWIESGEDREDWSNWGGNILFSYDSRALDRGNEIGQGVNTKTLIAGLDLSYELYHNLHLEASYFYRRKDSQINTRDQATSYFGGGIRMNISRRALDF